MYIFYIYFCSPEGTFFFKAGINYYKRLGPKQVFVDIKCEVFWNVGMLEFENDFFYFSPFCELPKTIPASEACQIGVNTFELDIPQFANIEGELLINI